MVGAALTLICFVIGGWIGGWLSDRHPLAKMPPFVQLLVICLIAYSAAYLVDVVGKGCV